MSWRPDEGWKNPYGLSDKVYAPELQLIEKGIHDAYEAGADAMHKAIVEWLGEDCMEHSKMESLGIALNKRHECADCWQELYGEQL